MSTQRSLWSQVIDGICARAEKGELALTETEFECLQDVVIAYERGWVTREEYDAMIAARDHCKRQTDDVSRRLIEANCKISLASRIGAWWSS